MQYFFKAMLLCVLAIGLPYLPLQAQDSDKMLKIEDYFGDMRARHIGPALMSGRVSDIAGHPTDPNVMLVGAAGGGVWLSNDAGVTYRPIFDKHIQSIGAVAFDPSDPQKTYWVGSGEPWVRNSVSVGDGIYVSKDGGENWEKKGLEKTERIASVIVHPENSQVIFAGALGPLWGDSQDRGVYKTEDGGESWQRILGLGSQTGCADLCMDPNDPNTLYASMWEFRRTAYSFNSGGDKSALMKSTDAGATWEKIHNGLPIGKLGRIGVAVAPSSSNIVYAVVESEKNEEKGLYRSEDSGASWSQVNNDFELTVRPFYFSRIVVHPTNPDFIAKGGLRGSISEDGGKTFRQIGGGVHADVHDFWFDIRNPEKLTLGSDGGVYRSWDKGYSWIMVEGLPLSQYYHIALDTETPYNIYGGLQDNGSWIGPSRSAGGITARDWQRVGYGDGFRVYPHSEKPHLVYSEMQGADNIWLVDTKGKSVKIVKPYPEDDTKLRFNWNAPITTSPHQADRFYVGSQFVHRSNDMGNDWEIISPDLTTNDAAKQDQENSGGLSTDNSGAENHCTVFTISESPLDENIIWAGTDDGNIQVTMDGGQNWKNVTEGLDGVPKNTWTYHIEPSAHDAKTAYAVFDGHTRNDRNPYVQKTTNGGQSWTSIATTDIEGFVRSIQEDLVDPNLLFLGTEYGLYISNDGGKRWAHFTNNLPPVAIHHLELQPQTDDLVMGTHGRGIIILDDISPLRQINEDNLNGSLTFLEAESPVQYNENSFGGYGDSDMFVGQNDTRSAVIPYLLSKRHVFGKMEVGVYDDQGRKVADLSPGKSKGINLLTWNYAYPLPKMAKGKTMAFGGFSAPSVPPGNYEIRIKKGKENFTKKIEVKMDPNSSFTEGQLKSQHERVMELYDMNEQLAFTVHQNDAIQDGVTGLEKMDGASKFLKQAKELKTKFDDLKKDLVITTGDNYVGSAEPELREKIASLYSDVLGFPGEPTKAQMTRLSNLKKQLAERQADHLTLLKEVNGLNKKLETAGLTPIAVPNANAFFGNKV